MTITQNTTTTQLQTNDTELDLLIRILAQILFIYIRDEAGRDEYSGILDENCQTAIENLRYLGLKHFAAVERLFNTFVAFLLCKALVSQNNLAFAIIDLEDFDLQFISRSQLCRQVYVLITVFFF
jgi:hypothetical protein